jgi:hypothetical protein
MFRGPDGSGDHCGLRLRSRKTGERRRKSVPGDHRSGPPVLNLVIVKKGVPLLLQHCLAQSLSLGFICARPRTSFGLKLFLASLGLPSHCSVEPCERSCARLLHSDFKLI